MPDKIDGGAGFNIEYFPVGVRNPAADVQAQGRVAGGCRMFRRKQTL